MIGFDHVGKAFTTASTDLVIDHATRQTRTRAVLRDLSVTFPQGEISAIVGRSGCGKSTMLKLLSGEVAPDEGEILLPEEWHTAMLSPNPYVITWPSVLRNVAMAAGAGRTPEERMELAERMVKLVHLTGYEDLTPVELSTGMRQRLGLARVLASRAELLLLDEPFASLDFITRAEMQQELLDIQREMPRTMLLVTHQLEEALLLAQHVYVVHDVHQDPAHAGDPAHILPTAVETFDLSGLAYPRDLADARFVALRQEITAACKR